MTGVSTVQIAAMLPEHAADVLAIYQTGIDEGQATFETAAPAPSSTFEGATCALRPYASFCAFKSYLK